MSKIIQNGKMFNLAEIEGTFDKLPLGVYNLNLSQAGFFLTKTADFVLPKKIYGDMSVVDRWLKTYNSKSRNVGVLLAGLKGGGKTITAKLLAIKANKPIICISQGYSGTGFIDFITNKSLGDCVIFMDEYEKVYANNDGETTDSLLSLLDGPYDTHHLFIFTVNETTINKNMMNRPSRILYAKKYEGLGEDEIKEIAEDILVNKKHMQDLLTTTKKIFQLSYDVLISIIEEVNRFDEPASECIKYMNLTPDRIRFDITQWYKYNGVTKERYAGSGKYAETDRDGNVTLRAEMSFKVINPNRKREVYYDDEYRDIERRYITLNVNNAEKIGKSDYEIFIKELNYSFVLTENVQNDYSSGYYSPAAKPMPKHEVGPIVTIYIDDNGDYIRHEPETVSKQAIEKFFGYCTNPVRKQKNNSKDLLWEDSGSDGECCAG